MGGRVGEGWARGWMRVGEGVGEGGRFVGGCTSRGPGNRPLHSLRGSVRSSDGGIRVAGNGGKSGSCGLGKGGGVPALVLMDK